LQASTNGGSSWSTIWNISGDQGNSWESQTVSLAAYTGNDVKLRFFATSGSSWKSDVAVDNISLSTSGGGGGGSNSAVTLTLVTDNYGSETSWTLKNSPGTTVASGSGYSNNTTYTETFSLPAGCYDFKIDDAYGDGICCTYGNGSYALKEGGTTLASGGSFGSTETKNFCVTNESATNEAATLSGSFELLAFPNPATVAISIQATGVNNARFTVMDITGKQVAQGQLINGAASIGLNSLKAGIYIVRAIEGEKVATTKFVKQ